jgi:hypothetical protein
MKPTICIDFDGVINSYKSGYGPDYKVDRIPDGPVKGTREAIKVLREEYRVVVQSTRCAEPEGKQAIIEWLAKYDIEVDEIVTHKPPAIVYVDDRAIQFRGSWDTALEEINEFEHWFSNGWDTNRYGGMK